MDQIMIGRFIADERKAKGLTQRQLAESLGISDKTVSKWECGNGFPEVSLLLPLCEKLEITVNDLLTGERVSDEEYRKKAEENMVNLVKEAQESKKKIILSILVGVLTIIAAVPMLIVPGVVEMPAAVRIGLYVCGSIVLVLGIVIACILDQNAGAYECPECGERFVPDMRTYVFAPHTLSRRKFTCPKCGAKKYCKKVLTKEKTERS